MKVLGIVMGKLEVALMLAVLTMGTAVVFSSPCRTTMFDLGNRVWTYVLTGEKFND